MTFSPGDIVMTSIAMHEFRNRYGLGLILAVTEEFTTVLWSGPDPSVRVSSIKPQSIDVVTLVAHGTS